TDSEIEIKNCAEHTAQFVPFLLRGKFGNTFYGGKTKTEVEQNSVAENAPEQRPETKLLGTQILIEHPEHGESKSHAQCNGTVIRNRIAPDIFCDFFGAHFELLLTMLGQAVADFLRQHPYVRFH